MRAPLLIARHRRFVALLGGLLLGALVGGLILGPRQKSDETELVRPTVVVASVEALSLGSSLLPFTGTVRSTSQASVEAKRTGQVTSLAYALGDIVPASAAIATLESQTERASIEQAEASLTASRAELAQLKLETERGQSTTVSEAFNTWRSAFIASDDAVSGKTDPFFENDRAQFPRFLLDTTSGEHLEKGRAEMTQLLRRWAHDLEIPMTDDAAMPRLTTARADLEKVESFLSKLALAVNRTPSAGVENATASESERVGLATARLSIANERAAVTAALDRVEQNIRSDMSGSGLSRENSARLAVTEARVRQAEAGLALARAELEKTVIRAPVQGTISSLELRLGDHVRQGDRVVTIVRTDRLEVIAFAPEDLIGRLPVGTEVIVDALHSGRVSRIAPVLGPETKKVEIHIELIELNKQSPGLDKQSPGLDKQSPGLDKQSPGLFVGRTVTISLREELSAQQETGYTIPLTALKLTAEGAFVFTVSDATLVAREITVDRVLGESVLISEGLTSDTRIVIDARGRRDGELVITEDAHAAR